MDGGSGPELPDSKWRVCCDLAWGHALVWFATFGRRETRTHGPYFDVVRTTTLLPGVHLYFADCYLRLAEIYEREGGVFRTMAAREKAALHLAAAGPLGAGPGPDDSPPRAAAALGIPRAPELVDARAEPAPSVPSPFPKGGLTPVGSPAPS
jgi:hypothetical protein